MTESPELPKTKKVKLYIHLRESANNLEITGVDMTSVGWPLIGTHEVVIPIPDFSPFDIAIARQQAKIEKILRSNNENKKALKEARDQLLHLKIQHEKEGGDNA